MKTIMGLLLLFTGLVYITSCEYETIEFEKAAVIPATDTMKFSIDIAPLFDPRCTGCHGASLNPDFRKSNSWNSLTTGNYVNTPSASSKLLVKINSGHNTATELTPTEKAKIAKWIDDGAKNN
jgi:hypothetical protein